MELMYPVKCLYECICFYSETVSKLYYSRSHSTTVDYLVRTCVPKNKSLIQEYALNFMFLAGFCLGIFCGFTLFCLAITIISLMKYNAEFPLLHQHTTEHVT